MALSAEKNLDKLLEMIVYEARKFTNSNGGTLYIMSDSEDELQFAIIQNESLKIRMGGTGGKIVWPPVKLKNDDGSPNYAQVSAYAAQSGEVVNIPDVYDAVGFNFEGTRHFDAETGYRSKSMLVVPMRNHENDIIGVLQLLNAQDAESGEVIAFSMENQELTESLASQAAVALSNNRLIQDLENLFDSFIRTIAAAVDEKSPYTGGHVRRVVDITMAIASKINETSEGPFANVHFSPDQLNELRIAAWLHDVGKITTPEYIIDKSKKLETICDRMEIIKARFEVIKRDQEIEMMKQGMRGRKKKKTEMERPQDFRKKVEEEFEFLTSANAGTEFMTDDMIEKIKDIAKKQWNMNSIRQPLLNKDEVYNLCIRKGTLTDEERDIINNHAVVTYKILSQLHFPKKLRNVPKYAAAHHEKLNGSGYPMGLRDEQISLQSRILALADIFEALTARDRPYKKGHALSEAMKIMDFMVKDNHIDADLFDLFISKGIHLEYGKRELSFRQLA
jgi:HD-GYP domain-containing protein (c-di-GMP phosphodiesterase class II)